MLQLDPEPGSGSSAPNGFVLYVEGPNDRSILREWSYRLIPQLAGRLFDETVILGGRQPVRAAEHFHAEVDRRPNAQALCILDRDDEAHGALPDCHANLVFFTWSRRHIESYLLIPEALHRVLGRSGDRDRMTRAFREHLPPPDDEDAHRELNAKRLLGKKGPLARALGRPLPLARIARATREPELHRDVHELFNYLRGKLGAADPVRIER